MNLIDEYDNLVVLRTVSKALAFAGARCGAVMGPVDVIRILNAVQPPYALATPVVECVEDAMRESSLDEAQSGIAAIVAERERVMGVVSKLPCVDRVWPSAANFFLVRVDDSDTEVARKLATYRERTTPMLGFYGRRGVPILDIDVSREMSALDAWRALHHHSDPLGADAEAKSHA